MTPSALKSKKYRAKLQADPIYFKAYTAYRAARGRCYNKNACNFKWYGAKGIQVLVSREVWCLWYKEQMLAKGFSVSDNLDVDRINPSGNYELSNMDLIYHKDNIKKSMLDNPEHGGLKVAYNRAVKVIYNGKEHSIPELARELGVLPSKLYHRIQKGLDIFKQENITKDGLLILHKGELKTVAEWSTTLGVNETTIRTRFKQGRSLDEIGNIGAPGKSVVWRGVEYKSISEAARETKVSRTTIYDFIKATK